MTNDMKGARRAFLLGLREDGSPTCHPMTAVMIGDEPSFNSYRKSVKIRNFLRDPRAAAVLLDGWQASPSTADCRQGVMVETPPPEMPAIKAEAVAEALLEVPDAVKQRAQNRVESGKRIYFRLKPEN